MKYQVIFTNGQEESFTAENDKEAIETSRFFFKDCCVGDRFFTVDLTPDSVYREDGERIY